jgi:glutathione synthase/RimK-type ligase-like ATP-grasp enzyme
MTKIYPYSDGSESAKALSQALGVKRLFREGKNAHVSGAIINWGNSAFYRDMTYETELLNHPDAVAKAVNKLEAFKALDGHVSIPKWTESNQEAFKWLLEGNAVVARHKLTGHSGEGIKIYEKEVIAPDVFEEAPLYTQYVRKRGEYRLHVFRDKVFFTQRKARNKDVPDEEVNWKIRNHANGFIFAHIDVDVEPEAFQHAIDVVRVLGLDFGAVDIIKGVDDKWYVLEVNTACGLEGTTLEKYVEVFKEFV